MRPVRVGRGLCVCRTGVVCFVSKMPICLCKVIPYDLPKYTRLGCPSGWQLSPPPPQPPPNLSPKPSPLTPATTRPGLEVLAFYLPLRGYEKADKAFHSPLLLSDFWISVILEWLQHVYSGLVVIKLFNAMIILLKRDDQTTSACPRLIVLHAHTHAHIARQHPPKRPKSQICLQSRLLQALQSYSTCANERCVLEHCNPLRRAQLVSRADIHSSPLDKFGTHTSNYGPKLMLRANSLPPPSPHVIPLCNYMLRSHPDMQE